MNLIQFVISIVLFAVLGFGIGFIINMVLKTTWLPTILTVIVIAATLIVKQIAPGPFDIAILAVGIIGVVTSGWTIQTLRKKGYRMF
ncbi:hypothetical protein MA20_47970 [Bradyrhizobium japonicum]|uniref:Uncharacterized protein n=1 Tax=Bradyrhizobium japonicum TaxID=375 RepID=A0A0A3XHU6_BRAJP|nr:hypothetical protein MA20_47970 [Bradyrhizobium japonicum]